MKRNKFIIVGHIVLVLLFTALLLTSCSTVDDEPSSAKTGMIPVTLTNSLETNGLTRATTTLQATQIANGEQVGVSVFLTGTTASSSVYGYINAPYTANGSGALTVGATKVYYPAAGGTVDIYAYAPYYATYSDSGTDISSTALTFTPKSDQSSDDNYLASDLLWATALTGKASSSSSYALTFAHKLSKITVSLTAGSGISTANLQASKIEILNTLPTTTLNLKTGALATASGTAAPITVKTTSQTTVTSASAVVVPQTLASGTSFIAVTIESATYTYKLAAATEFKTGNEYTYNITVTATGINVTSTIGAWTSNTASTGTATQQ